MTGQLPNVTLDIIAAGERVGDAPQKVLFVGQMIKNHGNSDSQAGTFSPAVGGSLLTNIPDDDDATKLLFGKRSMLATMLIAARKVNPITRFDAIVLPDNPAAIEQQGQMFFSGGPTPAAGKITFAIGSRLNQTFTASIAEGQTAEQVAEVVFDLINGALGNFLLPSVPVTANRSVADITLVAANRWKGASKMGIEILELPPAISVTLGAIASVTTDPVINAATFALIENERYQTIIWPESYEQGVIGADSYKPLIEDLEVKFNASKKVQDGVAIIALTENESETVKLATDLDTQVLSVFGNKAGGQSLLSATPSIFELSYVQSSIFGAIRALRFTKDADIARFVSATNGALDNFGGPHLASFPYFNTPFRTLPVIPVGRGWTPLELNDLVNAQVSILTNNDANTEIIALQVFTLSTTASTQNPNNSFEFLNFVDTISGVREYFFNNLKARYAQTRLTDGNLVRGVNIANANSIRAFMGGLYKDLSGPEFVLVQAGEAAFTFFKDHLVVTIDLVARKATIDCQVPIVTQLANIVGVVQISFSTNN